MINKTGQIQPLERNRVALLGEFMTCGLEEWISGSDTMLTSVKCTTSSGFINDPQRIELFANFFGGTEHQLNAGFHQKHGVPLNEYQYPMVAGKVLRIKKETFIRLIAHKNNLALHNYATDKLNFLKERINYLAKNTNNYIH
jgi:hypothetical protein